MVSKPFLSYSPSLTLPLLLSLSYSPSLTLPLLLSLDLLPCKTKQNSFDISQVCLCNSVCVAVFVSNSSVYNVYVCVLKL
jgi:hypothetical protein